MFVSVSPVASPTSVSVALGIVIVCAKSNIVAIVPVMPGVFPSTSNFSCFEGVMLPSTIAVLSGTGNMSATSSNVGALTPALLVNI